MSQASPNPAHGADRYSRVSNRLKEHLAGLPSLESGCTLPDELERALLELLPSFKEDPATDILRGIVNGIAGGLVRRRYSTHELQVAVAKLDSMAIRASLLTRRPASLSSVKSRAQEVGPSTTSGEASEDKHTNDSALRSLEADARALIFEDDADGNLIVGDARGEAGRVKPGTAGWACLKVLHRGALGTYMSLDAFAKAVDSVLDRATPGDAWTDSVNRQDGELDGEDRYARSQVSRRHPRGAKEPYASLSEDVLVDRLQAAIRKATPKGKAWRERWIHWDAAHGVILESW